MKVNFDAAVFGNNEVGLGCVGRSKNGSLLFLASIRLKVNWDAN